MNFWSTKIFWFPFMTCMYFIRYTCMQFLFAGAPGNLSCWRSVLDKERLETFQERNVSLLWSWVFKGEAPKHLSYNLAKIYFTFPKLWLASYHYFFTFIGCWCLCSRFWKPKNPYTFTPICQIGRKHQR